MNHDIVTITLNPAIDQTVILDGFSLGKVNRTTRHYRQPGGKGVNVSLMLGCFGLATTATGFLGQDNSSIFTEHFRLRNVHDEFIKLPGETRTGIKIVDEAARETTDLNFPGLEPRPVHLEELEKTLLKLLKPERWFVLAGSLPPNVDPGFFAKIIALLKGGGAKVAVDTSGLALEIAICGGVDLIKPNEHELAEFLGRELSNIEICIEAARQLQRENVSQVILSLGDRGALFISPENALIASAPPVRVVSTVGAGDAMLAGYLAGIVTGCSPIDRAKLATVFAWCALEDVRRELPSAAEMEKRQAEIQVRPLPTGRELQPGLDALL